MNVRSYTVKPGGAIPKHQAQTVAEELLRLYDVKGSLGPRDVVAAAMDEQNPLHGLFEWDDAKAAAAHRLDRARQILQSVEVVLEEDTRTHQPTRMLVSEPPRRGESYVPVDLVLSDADRRARYVQQALKEAMSWKKRYEHVAELADVFAVIETVATRKAG
jgi:hypothetical protein